MKRLGTLLSILFAPALVVAGEEPLFIRGNANMSEEVNPVNTADAVAIAGYLARMPHQVRDFDAADVNDDGFITYEDLIRLVRFLFKVAPVPPPPYPEAGTDPTRDTITHDSVVPPPAGLPDRNYKMWLYWATSPRSLEPRAILRMRLSYSGDIDRPATDAHGAIRFDLQTLEFGGARNLLGDDWEMMVVDFGKDPDGVAPVGEVGITVGQKDPGKDPVLIREGVDIAELKFSVTPVVSPTARRQIGLDYAVGRSNLYYYTGVGVFVPIAEVPDPSDPSIIPIWDPRFAITLRETTSRFVRSDSNGDGELDLSDAIFSLVSLFLGIGVPPCMDAADANDDGEFDISDPLFTIVWLFIGGNPPPPPYGSIPEACGLDPTEDRLGCEFYGPCYEDLPVVDPSDGQA
jgi:hypothetical protein